MEVTETNNLINDSSLLVHIPFAEIAIKMLISVGIGMLLGMERKWSHKDFGVRTFTIVSLLGVLSIQVNVSFAIVAFIAVFLLITIAAVRALMTGQHTELTTYAVLIAAFILGVLVGLGHTFAPVAAALVIAMLLAWKYEIDRFAGGLQPAEIRSAILMGLLGFVVYPLLPNRTIDHWHIFNPSDAWMSILVLAGIGFLNYILLRVYRNKGLFLSAIFGGLINSTATITEVCSRLSDSHQENKVTGFSGIINISMFLRNMILCAIFVPESLAASFLPLLVMSIVTGVYIWKDWDILTHTQQDETLNLSSPIALKKIMTFGLFFIAIQVGGVLLTNVFGSNGMLATGLIGGLVSSASTTAAAATLAMHGKISPLIAGNTAILSSIASAAINFPIVGKMIKDHMIVKNYSIRLLLIIVIGIACVVLDRIFGISEFILNTFH
ncbi:MULTISPECIES: MgtC/SapB family protein [Chitinophagaceae]